MRAWVAIASFALSLGTFGSARAEDGASLYAANCASCHGADGASDTPVAKAMSIPSLKGTSLDAEAIAKHVMTTDKHKAVAAKVNAEQLAAIAKAIGALGD